MKRRIFASVFALLCTATLLRAEQSDPRSLGILDEKVSRLGAQVEDLQFRQQQMQKDVESIRAELQEVRRAAGGVASSDLKALEDRIAAVDAARQADKKAIVDQLAKELSGIGPGRPATKPAMESKEHVVAKGETLSAIAKTYGVSLADLKKANNLSGDDIKIGQKLVIPK